MEDLPDIIRTIMDNSTNYKFDGRKIELSDEADAYLKQQSWTRNLEQLVQKVTSAVTSTEDRIISPDLLR